ncbi:RraA family protein [Actinoplanes subtropicus]|uniref:RraA family protein n=1 Tax=Actinoplanes subtropicus TaxID=543632 RepID=UPI0004C46CC5|nr:RraA family protein [Actinoplanes subtropicus]
MTAVPDIVRRRLTGRVPDDRIRTVDVPRHDTAEAAKLLALPDLTSAVADALDELGVGTVLTTEALSPLTPDMRVCGPAVTLRYIRANADPAVVRSAGSRLVVGDRDLYGVARPGDVAVVDCGGNRDWALLGGLSAEWALKAGLAGCLVDGAVRDTATIVGTGLPVWSANRSPRAARHRVDAVAINDVVSVAGASVRPGDYIVADADGVCVVPFEHLPAVADACVTAQATDDALVDAIRSSAGLEELVRRTSTRQTPE